MSRAAVVIIVISLALQGCMQSRYITEQYIKTQVEQHVPNTHSSIRTYAIFKSTPTSTTSRYVELTGYKYEGRKGLVIGADRYYRTASRMTGLPVDVARTTYVELTEDEARAMLDNIAAIRSKLRSEKAIMNEEVYHDYSVNADVYISVRKSASSSGINYIYLWIKGEKYPLSAINFPKKLKKFMDY